MFQKQVDEPRRFQYLIFMETGIVALEMEFTESTSSDLKKERFDSKSLIQKIAILDRENFHAKGKLGYDKTYVYVTLGTGDRFRVRFDLGTETGFISKLNSILALSANDSSSWLHLK